MNGSCRTIAFAGCSIAIDCDDADSTRIVERLYGHLPAAGGSIPPQAHFRLGRERRGGDFALFCDETLEYRGPCQEMVAAMLLDRSVHQLAVAKRDGALLHAGCVARGGRAVLLPGESGAGKTTLTAWLAKHAFDYLTDELVFLRSGSTSLEAFRRPLNVKRGAPRPVAALLAAGDGDGIMNTPDGFLLSPAVFGQSTDAAEAEARLIVFPSYREGAQLALQPISAARTAMRLLASLVNARQLPEHGLAQTTYLALTLPAYTLTWGDLDQIGEPVRQRLERALGTPRRVSGR